MKNIKQILLELLILDNNKIPSHTKFFSVMGYVMTLILFPYVTIKGIQVNIELWSLVLLTLIGNRSLNKLIEQRQSNDRRTNIENN